MTPRQRKIAYILFFSCFALWLFFILSGFLSSGQWTTTIVFANQFMLALFVGATILTSISSLLLGLNFLGISLRPRIPRQNLEKGLFLSTEQNNKTPKISSVNNPTNQNDPKKSKDSMKAFYLFGETKFKHCKHEFGHLGGVLKTKPIPDECFGCPKLLECVRVRARADKKRKPKPLKKKSKNRGLTKQKTVKARKQEATKKASRKTKKKTTSSTKAKARTKRTT